MTPTSLKEKPLPPCHDSHQVEEPLPVYRRALANAEDGTVAIASVSFEEYFFGIKNFFFQVGFMNNMAELLSSPPDEISELNGVDLVRQKVAKKTKRQKDNAGKMFDAGGAGGNHGRGVPRGARVQLRLR